MLLNFTSEGRRATTMIHNHFFNNVPDCAKAINDHSVGGFVTFLETVVRYYDHEQRHLGDKPLVDPGNEPDAVHFRLQLTDLLVAQLGLALQGFEDDFVEPDIDLHALGRRGEAQVLWFGPGRFSLPLVRLTVVL